MVTRFPARRAKPIVYCPVFLNINGRKCLVVGGGKVALRKAKMLLECGAKVTVISPTLHQGLARFVEKGLIRSIKRNYKPGDLNGASLAIAATDAEEINQRVSEEAQRRRIFINVVDRPSISDLIIPSFFRRGDLTVAVSTSGKSPALARKIRTRLEQNFGKEYGALLSVIEEIRSVIREKGITTMPESWQEALDLDGLTKLLRTGKRAKAKKILLHQLEADPLH